MTDPLDQVQQNIADLNNAMNVLFTDFVRPTTLQTQANAEAIAGLTQMMADAAVERSEQNIRIDNLLSDARADRQQAERDRAEWRSGFDEMREQMNRDREEWRAGFDGLREQAERDREEWRERFEENARRFDAQQQISQAMLVELARVNSRLEFLEQRAG